MERTGKKDARITPARSFAKFAAYIPDSPKQGRL
jgi:hypothetical protein